MNDSYDKDSLDASLVLMEAAAFKFAQKQFRKGNVRQGYISQIRKLSQEYRAMVEACDLSPNIAAGQVRALRDEIVAASQLSSSDIDSVKIHAETGEQSLDDLTCKYAELIFKRPYEQLASWQKNLVYLEIIGCSGQQRPVADVTAKQTSNLNRGLIVITYGVAIYNITSARAKIKIAYKDGNFPGSRFVGGAVNMLNSLVFSLGASVSISMDVFVGGALEALGTEVPLAWLH